MADEEALTNREELLWRNVHPAWIVDGKMTSQAFRPTSKDNQRLSCAREAKVSARDHFDEFTSELASVGVWAISVGEALDESLQVFYDEHSAAAPPNCPVGHTSVDFSALSRNKARRAGGRLRDRAESRGRQHP